MKSDLRHLTLTARDTLLHAMQVIDRGGIEVAFVIDGKQRVVGTLTDGDVRRAILRGVALDKPVVGEVMQKNFTSVDPSVGRAEVLDTMRSLHISQVPVLDGKRRLVGLHLLKELIGARQRPNTAVIMAGGLGVRLRPLTEHIPKPMLLVAGRPILERLVLHLVGYGIRDILLSVNYLGHVIESHFGDGSSFGCRIRYLRETEPLGTGGPLSLLPETPRHPVLVMNGDLVTQANIDGILDYHVAGGFVATACLRPYQVEVPFGVAEVRGGQLVGFREKPTTEMLINAGIYVLSARAIKLIPKGKPFPITSVLEGCIARKWKVGAHVLDGDWTDVGRHDELKKARGLG